MNFLEKIWMVLRRPSQLFPEIGLEEVKNSLIYYFILLIFFSAMYSIMTFAFLNFGIIQIPELVGRPGLQAVFLNYCLQIFVVLIFFGGAGIFVYAAWLHLWIYVFGGRESYIETLKSTIYSLTPVFLFGWVPIVSLILWIWYLILQLFSISQLHRISLSHAFFAFLISLVPIFLAFAFLRI